MKLLNNRFVEENFLGDTERPGRSWASNEIRLQFSERRSVDLPQKWNFICTIGLSKGWRFGWIQIEPLQYNYSYLIVVKLFLPFTYCLKSFERDFIHKLWIISGKLAIIHFAVETVK